MGFSKSDVPQGEQDAFDNNGLVFLSENILQRLTGTDIPFWSRGEFGNSADETDVDFPSIHMFDGHLITPSRSQGSMPAMSTSETSAPGSKTP